MIRLGFPLPSLLGLLGVSSLQPAKVSSAVLARVVDGADGTLDTGDAGAESGPAVLSRSLRNTWDTIEPAQSAWLSVGTGVCHGDHMNPENSEGPRHASVKECSNLCYRDGSNGWNAHLCTHFVVKLGEFCRLYHAASPEQACELRPADDTLAHIYRREKMYEFVGTGQCGGRQAVGSSSEWQDAHLRGCEKLCTRTAGCNTFELVGHPRGDSPHSSSRRCRMYSWCLYSAAPAGSGNLMYRRRHSLPPADELAGASLPDPFVRVRIGRCTDGNANAGITNLDVAGNSEAAGAEALEMCKRICSGDPSCRSFALRGVRAAELAEDEDETMWTGTAGDGSVKLYPTGGAVQCQRFNDECGDPDSPIGFHWSDGHSQYYKRAQTYRPLGAAYCKTGRYVDYSGQREAATLADCAALCTDENHCRFFAWLDHDRYGKFCIRYWTGSCSLEAGTAAPAQFPGVRLYRKNPGYRVLRGKGKKGRNYVCDEPNQLIGASTGTPVTTLEACAATCTGWPGTAGCSHFSWSQFAGGNPGSFRFPECKIFSRCGKLKLSLFQQVSTYEKTYDEGLVGYTPPYETPSQP